MDDPQAKILECLSNFDTAVSKMQIKNLTTAIDQLKEILGDQSVRDYLDRRSRNKDKNKDTFKDSWQDVFRNCHKALCRLDEQAEEDERKAVKSTLQKLKLRDSCLSLVGFVAKEANRDPSSPCLQAPATIDICLGAVTKVRWYKHLKQYASKYLHILHKNIISMRSYWIHLSAEIWNNVADMCTDMFDKVVDGDKAILVSILDICVSKGCSYSPLAIDLKKKKSLDSIEKMFVGGEQRQMNLEEALLKLCNTLMSELALECRMALCKFGENVFTFVLRIRRGKAENHTTMNQLYNFLLLQMTLHHPGGAKEDEVEAFAHDWSLWRKHLATLHTFVQEELQGLSVPRNTIRSKVNGIDKEINPALIQLTVEVWKQTFDMQNTDEMRACCLDDTLLEAAAKRRKLEIGVFAVIDQLKSAKIAEEITTQLQLLTAILKLYPDMFERKDYVALLEALTLLQSSRKNIEVMRHICRCCEELLKVESQIDLNNVDKTTYNQLWDKIWDMTLRSIGLNQCEESHVLLQALLKLHSCSPGRYASLLQLIASGSVQLSSHSVTTLSTLAEKCHLPSVQDKLLGNNPGSSTSHSQVVQDVSTSIWQVLLGWLIPGRESEDDAKKEEIPSKILAEALVRLCLKTRKQPSKSSDLKHQHPNILSNIKTTYELISLTRGITQEDQTTDQSNCININSVQVNTTALDSMLELLSNEFKYIVNKFGKESDGSRMTEKLSTIKYIVHYMGVFGYLLTFMLKWQVMTENDLQDHVIKEYLERLTRMLPEALRRAFIVKKQSGNHFEILKSLKQLYSGIHHKEVATLIRSEASTQLLELLLPLVKETSSGRHDFDEMSMGEMSTDMSADARERDSDVSVLDLAATSNVNPFIKIKEKTSLFYPHKLSADEKKQLLAAQVLTKFWFISSENKWTSNNTDELLSLLSVALDLSTSANITKVNIQKIVYVIYNASIASTLTQSQIRIIMEILKTFAQTMTRDPEIVLAILSVLYNMIPHLHKEQAIVVARNIAISIFKGFSISLSRRTFGSAVRVWLIKCLGKAAEVDPEHTWLIKQTKDVTSPLAKDIIEYMKDPFNEARLTASHCIKTLFCSKTPNWTLAETHKWHRVVFEELLILVTASFDHVKDGATDDFVNLTGSAFQSLGVVIVSSPEWRKKALFAIIQQAKKHKINIMPLKRTLEIVRCELKVSNIKQFLRVSLTFVLTQWLTLHYRLETFPWRLFDCETEKEFLVTYQEIIVPILVQQKNMETLQYVTNTITKSIPEVMEECYPKILSGFMPFIASKNNNLTVRSSDSETARILHEGTMEILGGAKCDDLASFHIDKIILYLFQNLHDPVVWQERITPDIPLHFTEGDFPSYNLQTMEVALQYFQSIGEEPDYPLLARLATDTPSKIQGILQYLTVSVNEAPTSEDRLKAFLQYSIFTEKLCVHLQDRRLGKATAFVVRDVIHVLLNLLESSNTNEQALLVSVCITLQEVCSQCILHCTEHFEPLLPIITDTLIKTIKIHTNDLVVNKALQVLRFLIVDNVSSLKNSIRKMDPFPSDEKFIEIQSSHLQVKLEMKDDSLESDITCFLNAGNLSKGNRVEGLIHLRSQLATRKIQLKTLYNQLQSMRGFSDECSSNLLHQLVCVLVKLASDPDKSVSLEAAKCLGELGPSDLSSLVLQPENMVTSPDKTGPQIALCKRKIELLTEYLVDSENSVIASSTLYSLLSTKEGQNALILIENNECLEPFKSHKNGKHPPLAIDREKFMEQLKNEDLWCPSQPCTHKKWITDLVCAILQTFTYTPEYLQQLVNVCKAKVEFSVEILPFLVNVILSSELKDCIALLAEKIKQLFYAHYMLRNEKVQESHIFFNKTSLQCMLNVIQFIRSEEHMRKASKNSPDLKLNYLHLSQAAHFCSAFFTSILYADLWGTDFKLSDNKRIRSINDICDSSDDGKALYKILLEGYKNIGDPDALHGCGMSRLLDSQSRTWYYEHCGEWDKVMLLQDISPNQPKGTISQGTAIALKQSGLHHMLEAYLEHQDNERMKPLQYECCWRLGQWDLPTATEVGREQTNAKLDNLAGYEAHHYSALKSLCTSDVTSLALDLRNSRNCIIQSLKNANLESSKNIYGALSQLQTLQELEDFSSIIYPHEESTTRERKSLNGVLTKWKYQDEITVNQFQYTESILSQRMALVGIARERQDSQNILHTELNDGSLQRASCDLLLQLARIARQEKKFNIAEKALRKLSEIKDIDDEYKVQCHLEDSQNLWDQGKKDLGSYLLLSVISNVKHCELDSKSAKKLEAEARRLYGTWLVESRSENAQIIINDYLMKAVEALEKLPHSSNSELVKAYKSLAGFADIEYQRIDKYMKSPIFLSRKQCMEKSRDTAKTLRQDQSQTKDITKAIQINEKQSTMDEIEFSNITKEKQKYLELALEYYLRSLDKSTADEEEKIVFRIVSLWINNKDSLGKCQALLEEKLRSITSYKFLSVVPQLVPHITNSKDKFDIILAKLLERLCIDHPHHTLPTLLALAEMYKDVLYAKEGTCSAQSTPEARVTAAQVMIKKMKLKPRLCDIITQMEGNSTALVQLAYHESKSNNIPVKMIISKVKNYDKMLLPTLNLPVNRNGEYKNIIGIHSYETTYQLVGGITAPKKVTCNGTDGYKRFQLIKGMDDLHQDAVMQQVFTIMNKLLKLNKNTRERKLLVRTYKVVPLSQRSGIIEWCENTEPIAAYLMKAHPKYHPKELTLSKCRESIKNAQRESREKRLRVYHEICKNLTPVFHNFFSENYVLPGVWFERRLAYAKSIATNSMIGYILGLGDRHVQNILVDKTTAEVIHIDFGIAFEQGLVLYVPETVPFRLTRDIEDGLGISGVEGVFRKTCEKTLEVLRENHETILTILQVLLYDPLYVWAISPERNQNERKGVKGARGPETSAVEVNKIAHRALLRLQQKLMGTEEGMATSIEGQVNRLIQEARDPENLCRLFCGWQAYL